MFSSWIAGGAWRGAAGGSRAAAAATAAWRPACSAGRRRSGDGQDVLDAHGLGSGSVGRFVSTVQSTRRAGSGSVARRGFARAWAMPSERPRFTAERPEGIVDHQHHAPSRAPPGDGPPSNAAGSCSATDDAVRVEVIEERAAFPRIPWPGPATRAAPCRRCAP